MECRPTTPNVGRAPPNARQLWSNTPAAEPPGCASSALDWRSRQESWRYSIFICHTYIARTLVVNDQTSKCKNRKFVVVKELCETWKASWNKIKHFLHFFKAVLTVFKSTLITHAWGHIYYTNSTLVIGHYRNVRGLGKSMVVFPFVWKTKIFKWKINYILESLPRIEVFGEGKWQGKLLNLVV